MVDDLLRGAAMGMGDLQRVVVDYGPGSFTGVKVGVTMAKVWAASRGCELAAISSFDLISADEPVAVPFRKGAFLVREPGTAPTLLEGFPPNGFLGYGMEDRPELYPSVLFESLPTHLLRSDAPRTLVPWYIAEPNVSQPKSPYADRGAV